MNADYSRDSDSKKSPTLTKLIEKLKEINLKTTFLDKPNKLDIKESCLSQLTKKEKEKEEEEEEYSNYDVYKLNDVIEDIKINGYVKDVLNEHVADCVEYIESTFVEFYTYNDHIATLEFNNKSKRILAEMIVKKINDNTDTSVIINSVLEQAFYLGKIRWKRDKYNYRTISSEKYIWKKDLDEDIDILFDYLEDVHETIIKNFNMLLTFITDENYAYLVLENQGNCTVNSTFHIFINYLIWSTYKEICSETYIEATISEDKLENIKKSIREYLNEWFALYTIKYNDAEAEKQLQEVKEKLLNQLTDGGNFHLCMIDYYYLVLHIFVYCETALEALKDKSFNVKEYERDNLTLQNIGYGIFESGDIDIINDKYKQEFTQRRAFIDEIEKQNRSEENDLGMNIGPYLRYSNKIGNIILEELFKRFGVIKKEDTLLLNDLKTPELDTQTFALETVSKKYTNAIIKYYNGVHANIIFIRNSGDDKILIDDMHIKDNTLDKNKFYMCHVIAGIHVAHTEIKKDREDRNKSSYKHGEIVESKYYIPTTFFFNGGAIISILLIICVVAIVVCVVIYVHDHYWFKTPTQIKAKPKI